MALSPIPARMLHDTAVFHVVTGMDRYQRKTYEDFEVEHVHLQSSNETRKTAADEEVLLRGILFVDGRRSTPAVDLYALQERSLKNGDTMRVTVSDASGAEVGNYAVLVVDGLPDVPATRTHHWEIGLT